MIGRWRERTIIPAIHENDFPRVIHELGLSEKISSGSIICSICSTPITFDNIGCIYVENKEIKLCCDSIICYKTAIQNSKKD